MILVSFMICSCGFEYRITEYPYLNDGVYYRYTPRTHYVIKKPRAYVHRKYSQRMAKRYYR